MFTMGCFSSHAGILRFSPAGKVISMSSMEGGKMRRQLSHQELRNHHAQCKQVFITVSLYKEASNINTNVVYCVQSLISVFLWTENSRSISTHNFIHMRGLPHGVTGEDVVKVKFYIEFILFKMQHGYWLCQEWNSSLIDIAQYVIYTLKDCGVISVLVFHSHQTGEDSSGVRPWRTTHRRGRCLLQNTSRCRFIHVQR